MSQAGKILHLYVEVRSVGEEEGKEVGGGDDGSNQLMLQGPDLLPQSQRSSGHPSPSLSPATSPGLQHRARGSNHSLAPSKSSSRHSVSFQLHSPDPTSSLPQIHRQSLPCDSVGQLLQVLVPGATSPTHHSSLVRAHSSDMEPYQGRAPISPCHTSSGRLAVPTMPTVGRRSYKGPGLGGEEGKRSVVTFSYIEKASVQGMDSPSNSLCQSEMDSNFSRVEGRPLPAHLRKRLSDPVWYDGREAPGSPDSSHPYPSWGQSPQGSPYLWKATLDSVAREATYRALEEFGSPELRRRLAGHGLVVDRSPTSPGHHRSPRCQSWAGSPVLPRSACTLPPNTQVLDPNRAGYRGSVNGLPRSPASEQLSAHARYIYHAAPASSVSSYIPPQSQQRPWLGDESPRLSSKFRPPLPAGRPTDIQHEIPASMLPSINHPRTNHHANDSSRVHSSLNANNGNTSHNASNSMHYNTNNSPCLSSKTHYKPSVYSRASDVISPPRGSRSGSPATSPEVARKLALEAAKLSTIFMDQRTPSPTPSQADSVRSESPRNGGLFPRESQLCATFHGHSSPEQPPLEADNQDYAWKTSKPGPYYQPGYVSLPVAQKGLSSPASPARLHRVAASHSPVLDPRQQHNSSPGKDTPTLHRHRPPQFTGEERRQHDPLFERSPPDSPVSRCALSGPNTEATSPSWTCRYTPWTEDGSARDRDELRKENHRLSADREYANKEEYQRRDGGGGEGGVSGEQRGEVQDNSGAVGTSSQSSSGVTGSLGDSSQPDRDDCLSPETSSQSSHRSIDTADTASGMQSDSGLVPGPSSRSQKIARAKWEFLFGAPTEDGHRDKDGPGTTPPPSNSPSPTPPSSLHLKPANQRRGPDSVGQRLSHHEVQQIEVELVTASHLAPQSSAPKTGIIRRTIKYSETDLDAVPLRCYRETDLDEVMQLQEEVQDEEVEEDSAFGSNRSVVAEEEEEAVEEEEEEEEEVVSWASVRMQGDRKRQRATQEEDEVYSLLLKRPLEQVSDVHTALKSPVSVSSPCKTSDSHLDSFSRHFESIMESHRAKGTSYSSLDSVDLLTSGGTPIFTFDLPTLTPEIQSQICESARQIMELSFAPLAKPDPAGVSETSRSETTLPSVGVGLTGSSKDDSAPRGRPRSERESWRHANLRDSFHKANSAPSLHCSTRERPVHRPPELLYPQADVAERLALANNDALPNGTKADLQAAKRLAKRLFNLDGFRKSDIARHLSKNNDFSRMVAEEYLSHFNFTGLTIDQALRVFLGEFALMGETQERERVLCHFSNRYLQCNPNTIPNQDSVHTLTCAVMLLNTDLHGHNIGKRMSCSQFISNLEGLNDGRDFPKELLKALYSSIKNEKLQWTIDEEELRKSMSELADVRTDSASHTMKRIGSGGNPLVGVAQQSDGVMYKNGFLVRKVHADPDGKRTPRGRRGWKSFYAMLKGLVLYLHKGEYHADHQLSDEDLKNAVSIHHSLAMRAADYRKRPNVFYLRTADWRVFLFQAPNADQMQSWITRINTVAAMFSAPPFPAAIGSQKRFSRPLLPGSNTKLSQEEQVKSHESRFRAVSSELADLMATPPDRKVKGRELEEHKLREEYLEFEKTRYGTYAMLLRAKLRSGDQDLTAFEARLFDDGGLQRAHSSPTLPQESSSSQASSTKEKSQRSQRSSKTSSANREGSKKKSSSQRSDPQRQSWKQAAQQGEGP